VNKLNIRFLVIAIVVVAVVGIGTQAAIITTLAGEQQSGLISTGWVGSFWVNLIAASSVAIIAARRAAKPYTDPRIGRVVGAAMGLWVGLGSLIGQVLCALFLRAAYGANRIPAGQVVVFGLILLAVSVVSAAITGRETAHPPEDEESD
jgi:hypothetical protein